MSRLVFVHPNCRDLPRGYESIGLLVFLGYKITETDWENADFIIDCRMAGWRGWGVAIADFTWRHYDRMVEWNRQRDAAQQVVVAVELDTEEGTCYT